MSYKRGDVPRRLMTKVRKKFHRPTMEHTPKTVYDRNSAKRELERIVEEAEEEEDGSD